MQGVFPSVGGCARCGTKYDAAFALDVPEGALLCASCRAKQALEVKAQEDDVPRHDACLLSPGALEAIRFSLSEPLSRMTSFRLADENELRDFTRAGELFLCYHLDIDSTALHMYTQMRALGRELERSAKNKTE